VHFHSYTITFWQEPMYKEEHCTYFREAGLLWPPDLDKADQICFDGLGNRASESVYFVHKQFPPDAGHHANEFGALEFFDSNVNLKRLMAVDAQGKYKSPWHSYPLCISSQTQLIVRHTLNDVVTVRRAGALELFNMIGWFPDSFDAINECPGSLLEVGFATSICGNAFSAYQVGPVMLAFCSAAGSIANPPAEEVLEIESQSDDSRSVVGHCSDLDL
jgi:hypothetical protein